jgi:cytoskeletal protein CcmA (bactofilin family)
VIYVSDVIQVTEVPIQRVEVNPGGGTPSTAGNSAKIPAMAQEPGRTLIDVDTSIDGKINGKDATIAGKFKGEIHLTGSLVLTPSAVVDATVQAEAAEVGGAFSGKIAARKVVVLETGKITGTLDAGQLVVREGAILNGPVAAGKSASGGASPTAAPAPAAAPAKS